MPMRHRPRRRQPGGVFVGMLIAENGPGHGGLAVHVRRRQGQAQTRLSLGAVVLGYYIRPDSSSITFLARAYNCSACSGVSPTAVSPTRPATASALIMWKAMPV